MPNSSGWGRSYGTLAHDSNQEEATAARVAVTVNIMALNTSDNEVIAERRQQVARLRLRGLTQRDIARALNCSIGTVNGDLRVAREQWQAAAASATHEHQARVLAEIHEVRRMAWAQPQAKGLPVVLQAL